MQNVSQQSLHSLNGNNRKGTIEKEQCFLVHEKKQKQHYSPSTLEAKVIENIDQDHCWLRQSTSGISLKGLKNEKDG